MAVPVAPSPGAPILEAWGDLIHDQAVAMEFQYGLAMPGDAGSGAVSSQQTVVFPHAFASPPTLLLASHNFNWFAGLNGAKPTASQFVYAVNRPGANGGDATQIGWLAYGPRLAANVPNPPTNGEPIAEAWGDVAHDSVVGMDIQTGFFTPAPNSGEVSQQVTVTFARPFGAAPIVTLCTDNYNSWAGLNGNAPSTTGFTAACRRYQGNNNQGHTIMWIAYGPRLTVPTPPTAGEPIAEAWGDLAHASIVDMELQTGHFVVGSGSGTSTIVPVTFPHPFAAVPQIAFQNDNFNSYASLDGNRPTANGFAAACRRPDGGATGGLDVQWVAYGKRA